MSFSHVIASTLSRVKSAFSSKAQTTTRRLSHRARSRRLTIEGLENRSVLAAGGLDNTFDGDGRFTNYATSSGSSFSYLNYLNSIDFEATSAKSMVSRSDGKFWVAGNVVGTNDTGWISLQRRNANGTPDNSFDNNGEVAYFYPRQSYRLVVADMKVQKDGKILIAGTYHRPKSPSNSDIFLLRYNSNGTLDKSFGTEGLARHSWGGVDLLTEISAKSDGKIVIVGTSNAKGTADIVVARYNADGTPDKSFNKSGRTHVDVYNSQADIGVSLKHVDGGKILAVGTTRNSQGNGDFALLRLTSSGKLDKTFSGDGKLKKSMGGNDVVTDLSLDSSKRPVVLGYTSRNAADSKTTAIVARFNSNGSLSESFGTEGVFRATDVASDTVVPQDLHVLSDGRIIVVGLADVGGDSDFFVARITASGKFDKSFGNSGVTVTNFSRSGAPFPSDVALGMNLTSDGKILVCGFSINDGLQSWAIARYLAS